MSILELLRTYPETVPAWFIPTWLCAFGLLVGSFLNVVIHRVPRGLSIVSPRSSCPGCGHMIPWYENIPVLSWLVLRARCRKCEQPIAFRYTFVELLTGALTLACWIAFGWTVALPIALLFSYLMIALVFTDAEHMLLPHAITLPGIWMGLALSPVNPLLAPEPDALLGPTTAPANALLGVLVGFAVIEGMNLLYKMLRGQDGFGAGDTNMLMLMGAFLGWRMALLSLMVASALGVLIGIPGLLIARARAPEGGLATAESDEDDEPEPEEPEWRGGLKALWDLAPRVPEEILAPLCLLALLASFAFPHVSPESSVTGLLVGLALMYVLNRLRDRRPDPPLRYAARATELLPLLGALAGIPATPLGAGIAVVVAILAFATRGLLKDMMPGLPDESGDMEGLEDEDVPATSLAKSALPLGVFLGMAGVFCLFLGQAALDWWIGRSLPPPGF